MTDDYIINNNSKFERINSKTEPSFIRDIAPTLQPSILICMIFAVYIYTGNMLIIIWLGYLLRPFYDNFVLDDTNLADKTIEKKFVGKWYF